MRNYIFNALPILPEIGLFLFLVLMALWGWI
jgi:hypothetical protein